MNEQVAAEPRILKICTCPSLSARASLTYHVGCNDKGDVCFRIWDTSGKGVYSKEWVSAADIQKVLAQHQSIAAPLLLPLFKAGRSVNTAGFLLAVLKNEGLVVLSADAAHRYERKDSDSFVAEVQGLIKAGTNLDPAAQPPAAKKKSRRTADGAPWNNGPQPV